MPDQRRRPHHLRSAVRQPLEAVAETLTDQPGGCGLGGPNAAEAPARRAATGLVSLQGMQVGNDADRIDMAAQAETAARAPTRRKPLLTSST
jgi:hypothetical protein